MCSSPSCGAANRFPNSAAWPPTDGDDDASHAPGADAELLSGELADAIVAAVAELAPRTREVFMLSREQGLTYNEIAAALGISVKTVETLMGRALRALRTRLSPHVTGL